jgi:hypothetical protein
MHDGHPLLTWTWEVAACRRWTWMMTKWWWCRIAPPHCWNVADNPTINHKRFQTLESIYKLSGDDSTIDQKIFQTVESINSRINTTQIWSRSESRRQKFWCHLELVKIIIPTLNFLLCTEEILLLIAMKNLMRNMLQIILYIPK